jgi:signal transduction histidine kinase
MATAAIRRRLAAPHDPRGRLISIFVGAVLLPSLALSYVSLNFVPRLAEGTRLYEQKRAERILFYLGEDLQQTAQVGALEAARVVGTEKLLDGRPEEIAASLEAANIPPNRFDSLHLEASSPRRASGIWRETPDDDLRREVLGEVGLAPGVDEDSTVWTGPDGQVVGMLRYRYNDGYVRHALIRDYFEKSHQDAGIVFRVADRDGNVVYETAPTPDDRFEMTRPLESPSFAGLSLSLRYRDRSIEQEVRRWELGTLALIGFIDLMLAAGLYLVFNNVRREMNLSRLKSDFVANVSHELKTPLALVRLYAETLELGRVPNEDKKHQYYRVILQESQRLTQLINNILDFSRIEAGRKEYRFGPTDVAAVVQEVVDAYRFHIEQQGFTLEVEVEEGLPAVDADKEALGQALLNLMNNAVKYSREEKSIRMHVRRAGDEVRVSVTDQGIGVAKGEQGKIFEKFYRAEDSLVHETKGSGLGLPLVRHIMEAHGGKVDVESTPGRGSTFTLVLPIRSRALEPGGGES